jgi:hypothetical protein
MAGYLRNKKAWIAIVEVSVAIVVLFAFLLLTFNQESKKETNRFVDLNKAILFQVEENETFRNLVLTGDTMGVQRDLQSYLQSFLRKFNAKINLTVCTASIGEPCSGSGMPSDKDIISYDVLVEGNKTIYEPKKLRVFVWEE